MRQQFSVSDAIVSIAVVLSAAIGVWWVYHQACHVVHDLAPTPPPVIVPVPVEPQRRPRRPWREDIVPEVEIPPGQPAAIGGPQGPGGVEVACDLPPDLLKKNIASRGLGCCVFRSLSYLAIWQNLPQLIDFPEWMVQHGVEGGGYPEKVARLIPQICQDRGLPVPVFVQYEGPDATILDAAIRTGRPVGVTYNGHDPHYGWGTSIAHMVTLVYLDGHYAAIRDNNFTGPDDLVWLTRNEFLKRWRGGGSGWAVVFLAAPPPPPPHNR